MATTIEMNIRFRQQKVHTNKGSIAIKEFAVNCCIYLSYFIHKTLFQKLLYGFTLNILIIHDIKLLSQPNYLDVTRSPTRMSICFAIKINCFLWRCAVQIAVNFNFTKM